MLRPKCMLQEPNSEQMQRWSLCGSAFSVNRVALRRWKRVKEHSGQYSTYRDFGFIWINSAALIPIQMYFLTGCLIQQSLKVGRIFLWTTASWRSSSEGCWPTSSSKGSWYSPTGPEWDSNSISCSIHNIRATPNSGLNVSRLEEARKILLDGKKKSC